MQLTSTHCGPNATARNHAAPQAYSIPCNPMPLVRNRHASRFHDNRLTALNHGASFIDFPRRGTQRMVVQAVATRRRSRSVAITDDPHTDYDASSIQVCS